MIPQWDSAQGGVGGAQSLMAEVSVLLAGMPSQQEGLSPADYAADVPVIGAPPASMAGNEATMPASLHRQVQTPVGGQGWAEEIAARLTVLGARGEQTASLRLSPEHLGPVEVRITILEDKASIWFGAAHAQTREAIEQALPRLREMLQSQGLTLSDAGVFDDGSSRDAGVPQSGSGAAEAAPQQALSYEVRYQGLLDLYA